MKNKGFTLIELLAVIVILAIIALIAVPIVLNIIKDSKESSTVRSAELYMDAVNLAVTKEMMDPDFPQGNVTCEIQAGGNLSCYEGNDNTNAQTVIVEVKGDIPKANGVITFTNGKVTSVTNFEMPDGSTYEYTNGKLVKSSGSSNNNEGGGEQEDTYAYLTYTGSSVQGPGIGGDASSLPTSEPTNKNYYLKYKLDNDNQVTNVYVCAKFAGDEYCVEGGSSSYYGWDTDAAHSTGNVEILYGIQQRSISGVSCNFDSDTSGCVGGSFEIGAGADGFVDVIGADDICAVNTDGSSNCGSLW